MKQPATVRAGVFTLFALQGALAGCQLTIDPNVLKPAPLVRPTQVPDVKPSSKTDCEIIDQDDEAYQVGRCTPPSARPQPEPYPIPIVEPQPWPVPTTPTVIIDDWLPPLPCYYGDMGSQVAIQGNVFDEQGVPFQDGVEVRIANKTHSFEGSANVVGGSYAIDGAPAGEQLEITATHSESGWSRRRFITPAVYYDGCGSALGYATVNFGGGQTTDDPLGARYPIPEVNATRFKSAVYVQGTVFDVQGRELEGAQVSLSSLDADHPYEAVAETSGGLFSAKDVPAGVPVRVKASKPGYYGRDRVTVFFGNQNNKDQFNFGGPPTRSDPEAPQYGLAKLPPKEKRLPISLRGMVIDLNGKPLVSGVVRVVSLNPDVAYEGKAEIQADGTYQVGDIPRGIEVRIVVTAPGYFETERVERLRPAAGSEDAKLDFGGEASQDDPQAAAFAPAQEQK